MNFGSAYYKFPGPLQRLKWWAGDKAIQFGHFLNFLWKNFRRLFKKKSELYMDNNF